LQTVPSQEGRDHFFSDFATRLSDAARDHFSSWEVSADIQYGDQLVPGVCCLHSVCTGVYAAQFSIAIQQSLFD